MNNIANLLKRSAKIIPCIILGACAINLIASLYSNEYAPVSNGALFFAIISSIILSLCLYGFGELIEQVTEIAKNTRPKTARTNEISPNDVSVADNSISNQYDNAYYSSDGATPYVTLTKAVSIDITTCRIHANTRIIKYQAFENCYNLSQISIPAQVSLIGNGAFENCFALNSITFEGTTTEWKAISKGRAWMMEVPATYVACSDGKVPLK